MDFPAKVTKYLKGTLTLKNIPFKMNIYVKESSVSVTKVTMASFERRFLTIKVTKFASMEAEVLVITMVIPEVVGMYTL